MQKIARMGKAQRIEWVDGADEEKWRYLDIEAQSSMFERSGKVWVSRLRTTYTRSTRWQH